MFNRKLDTFFSPFCQLTFGGHVAAKKSGHIARNFHEDTTLLTSGNPIIRNKYTADPTALVYDNTIYIYTGHDEAPIGTEAYVMNDWLCFSSTNMVNWHEHQVPLKATDFSWAKGKAYASKVIEHDGSFYWYVAVNHSTIAGSAIGVAKAKKPTGPFVDARGSALITIDMLPSTSNEKANLDPSVIVDDNQQAYIFWGNGICYYAKLKPNIIELDGPIRTLNLPEFVEGANIHKHNDWYYLSYGYEMPEKVAYAMSRSIDGPWEFKGILNEIAGNCETNRPAILNFKSKSYFIYHNGALQNGGSHRRSVCIDYLYYNPDGTMKRVVMTSEGVRSRLIFFSCPTRSIVLTTSGFILSRQFHDFSKLRSMMAHIEPIDV